MAGNSFQRTKVLLGLTDNKRVDEYISLSPFDYKGDCLLYIPGNSMQDYPDDKEEALSLSEQILALTQVTHGHTLVLFTSYSLMGAVYKLVKDRLVFPFLEVWKNSQEIIRQFKEHPNAVLFAAGSC